MKVAVSCAGRFHAFNLVEQLYRRGLLSQFITTTLNDKIIPNRELPGPLKSDPQFRALVRELPMAEYLCALVRRLPLQGAQSAAYFIKDNLFDRKAVQYVKESDIFVGWANQSLFQLREARTFGAKTIIERGSSHIRYQHRILEEERSKLGLASSRRGAGYDQRLEEKQLKEYHETDYIMVPSEFARRSFAEEGVDPQKVLKVRYGVDLSRFVPGQLSRPTGVLKILFVGPLGIQKGIRYLLEAVHIAKLRGVKLELTAIGMIEPEFERWLKNQSLRTEIDTHISYLPNRELVPHFQTADLFCLPSLQEGLALVIAEAMACGLPVLATESSGAHEFVRDELDGKVIPAGDSTRLADAIEWLASDRRRLRAMGANALERSKEFSWDAYGDEIAKVYSEILSPEVAPDNGAEAEVSRYYDEYWDQEKGWTPSHSFTDEQLSIHFRGAFDSHASVLDVGCGDASNYQSWLVNQVGKLSAIDISKTGIERAKKLGLDAQVHDFSTRFPFSDATFDGATCIEVLEHLYDPKFCVGEIARVLRPGGLLVTSVPNNGYFRERLKSLTKAELSTSITDFSNEWKGAHIRFYSLKSFTRMLKVSGFEIDSVRSNGDGSIFDGLDAFGGYVTQQVTTKLRRTLPRLLKLGFLQDVWPSLFAPHIIVWARKK